MERGKQSVALSLCCSRGDVHPVDIIPAFTGGEEKDIRVLLHIPHIVHINIPRNPSHPQFGIVEIKQIVQIGLHIHDVIQLAQDLLIFLQRPAASFFLIHNGLIAPGQIVEITGHFRFPESFSREGPVFRLNVQFIQKIFAPGKKGPVGIAQGERQKPAAAAHKIQHAFWGKAAVHQASPHHLVK